MYVYLGMQSTAEKLATEKPPKKQQSQQSAHQQHQAQFANNYGDLAHDLIDQFIGGDENGSFGLFATETSRPEDQESSSAPLQDNSAALTRRLAAANRLLPIQMVIADANKDMNELRLVVAMGSREDAAKASAIIRRLERVVRRSSRKIRDLNAEDNMRRRRDRAERQEQIERAREIERELQRRIRRRRHREREWVRDAERDAANCRAGEEKNPFIISGSLDAATKAKIAAKAAALAAAQVSLESITPGSVGGGFDANMSAGNGGGDLSGAEISGASIDAVV